MTGPWPTTSADEQISDEQIPDPPRLLRLGSMIKSLLDEIHAVPLDERGRERLLAVHARAVAELDDALPAPLREEFAEIAPQLRIGTAVSDAELRIAEAQLVGWLEGLFQGVQFSKMVHQADRLRGT